MLLWAAAIVPGIAVGYLLGGRLTRLTEHRIRKLALLWLAFAVQFAVVNFVAARTALETLHMPSLIVVYGLSIAWVIFNIPRRPLGLTIAGALLLAGCLTNAIVIAANGRMPASYQATVAAGVPPHLIARVEDSPKHMWMSKTTRLPWLSDTIPFRFARLAVSPGDIVLMTGIATALAAGMRPSRRRDQSQESRRSAVLPS